MASEPLVASRRTFADRRQAGYAKAESAAAMWSLAIGVLREAVRPPFSWVPDATVETSTILRRCIMPLIVCVSVFLAANGVYILGRLIESLGAPDRQASGIFVGTSREVSTWTTMMVFAGIAGSAVTADLGARKIREELDAMSVLGVKALTTLVVPRVMAFTFCSVLLGVIATLVVIITDYVLVPSAYGLQPEVLLDAVRQAVLPIDVYSQIIKHAILGFLIGVICCSKGLQASGGSEGVGRAVNQAVVISFFTVWMFNVLYNTAYLSLFPDASVLRG